MPWPCLLDAGPAETKPGRRRRCLRSWAPALYLVNYESAADSFVARSVGEDLAPPDEAVAPRSCSQTPGVTPFIGPCHRGFTRVRQPGSRRGEWWPKVTAPVWPHVGGPLRGQTFGNPPKGRPHGDSNPRRPARARGVRNLAGGRALRLRETATCRFTGLEVNHRGVIVFGHAAEAVSKRRVLLPRAISR